MVAPDRGDDRGGGCIDDVRGVEPAAQPDFEQQHVGRLLGEE